MPAKNRLSISFGDQEWVLLEHAAAGAKRSKAEVVRIIVREFFERNPDRFRHDSRSERPIRRGAGKFDYENDWNIQNLHAKGELPDQGGSGQSGI